MLKKLLKLYLFPLAAVAAEIHTKPRWEDDWENAVKKTFKTSENKNLGRKCSLQFILGEKVRSQWYWLTQGLDNLWDLSYETT